MPEPIQVKLYLQNGTLAGYVRGEIAHWTGGVCGLSYTDLSEHRDEPMLSQSGVYFLLGQNEWGQRTVYVGKSIRRRNGNSFIQRLLEHTRDHLRGRWSRAVCVTNEARNGNREMDFNYLEFRFYELVKQAGLTLLNRQIPSQGDPSTDTRESFEIFIKKACILLSILGVPISEVPVNTSATVAQSVQEGATSEVPTMAEFWRTYKDGTAYARRSANGQFVLLAGSHIAQETTRSCPPKVLAQREDAKREGILRNGCLIKDLAFGSPSAAAKFVCGTSMSGPQFWRDLRTNESLGACSR